MLHRTEGIIFTGLPYGEADLIVTALTPDIGFIKLFAKSPRKTKSRFGSSLEPFTHVKLAWWGRENAPMPRLTQADIIHPYQALRENFECFVKVSEIFEITLKLLPERDPNEHIFTLLVDTLKSLEIDSLTQSPGRFSPKKYLFYKIKLLAEAGISPRLSGCAVCGKSGKIFYFHEGSVVCESCSRGKSSRLVLSQGAVSLYESIRKWPWDKLNRIVPAQNLITEVAAMINLHVRYRIDKGIRSRYFMDKTLGTGR
jgi:DNA repair protein RecO (recombination protein O)